MSGSVDRHRLRRYLRGLDALAGVEEDEMQRRCDLLREYIDGAGDYGDEYGPLSPEQLAKLDRVLTPAEQKAVDDWQTAQAEAQLKEVRKTPGPRSATVSAVEAKTMADLSRGAVIARPRVAEDNTVPWWVWALGAAAVVGVGAGVYKMRKRRR